MNMATTTGSTITIRNPRTRAIRYAAAAMTRNRHAHAAARSTPHGTCAREKLEVPATTGSGGDVRRSVRPRESVLPLLGDALGQPLAGAVVLGLRRASTGASDRVSSAPLPTRTG